MLKYKILGALVFFMIVMLLFTGCFGGKIMLNTEGPLAEACMEKIVEAISDNDTVALKTIFSKQALVESENIDEDASELYEFIEGDITSWGEGEYGGWSSSSSYDHGNTTTMIRGWYTIETSKGAYSIFILFYPEDDTNSDNVGLYTLWMCKVEDKETFFTYWQDMNIAGIHIPDEPQS